MKSVISKENNYSLQNSENYRKDFNCNISEIVEKYSELIMEYFKLIMENIKVKNSSLSKFIIIRGLDTITNVFLHILYFTKNIDLTYFHSQKSYYFYVEFVGQISDDEKTFLQLTSQNLYTGLKINENYCNYPSIYYNTYLGKYNIVLIQVCLIILMGVNTIIT